MILMLKEMKAGETRVPSLVEANAFLSEGKAKNRLNSIQTASCNVEAH